MKKVIFLLLFLFGTQIHADTFRVSVESLKQQLDNSNVLVIDARKSADFNNSHIKGAISFPSDLTYAKKKESGQVVTPNAMQKLMRERGIDKKYSIVVYDNGALVDAARMFWVFQVYGINNVKILSSGFDDWSAKKYPISSEPTKIKPSQYIPTVNHKYLASKFATQLASADNNQIIVDARFPDGYNGKTSTAKRYGHIPNATNFPISLNIEKVEGIKKVRSVDDLRKAYSGLPKDKKIIAYCEIGRASSMTFLVLRELGYDVANYDASWREWGNDLNLPIEN